METLLLLADAQTSDPLKLVGQAIIVLLTATGLASLFVRGFYVKFVEPMFLASVTAWFTHETQKESRKKETQQTVESWYRSPEVQTERKATTEVILDNHIHRDDGLINREIHQRVATSADALNTQIEKQRQLLEVQAAENRKFQEELLSALRELQTSVSYLHGRQGNPTGAVPTGRPMVGKPPLKP